MGSTSTTKTISPARIRARPIIERHAGVTADASAVGPSTDAAAKHLDTRPAAACNAPVAVAFAGPLPFALDTARDTSRSV